MNLFYEEPSRFFDLYGWIYWVVAICVVNLVVWFLWRPVREAAKDPDVENRKRDKDLDSMGVKALTGTVAAVIVLGVGGGMLATIPTPELDGDTTEERLLMLGEAIETEYGISGLSVEQLKTLTNVREKFTVRGKRPGVYRQDKDTLWNDYKGTLSRKIGAASVSDQNGNKIMLILLWDADSELFILQVR